MKAACYRSIHQPLELIELPTPSPKAHEILIRVRACGICGSDIHASEAEWTPNDIVMGHEFAGEVAVVGSSVNRWKVGDRVVPLSQVSCGQCQFCLAGDNSNCAKLRVLGYDQEYNGGYAEYICVGEHDALLLPDTLDFDEGAAIEPLAVGLDAVRRARLTTNESVLIIGAGPVGLAVANFAKHFGATHVVVAEYNTQRLALAKEMGATATIDANENTDTIAAYERLTGSKPSVIFEVVGVAGMIQRCIEMAEPKTRIVVVGVCQKADSFEPSQCTLKSLELIFPYGYSLQDYQQILTLMVQGRINVKPLISHHINLEALPEMFERMRKPTDQCKVIVEP